MVFHISSSQVLAQWLSRGDLEHAAVLAFCEFQPHPARNELSINCSTPLLDYTAETLQRLSSGLDTLELQGINLFCQGQFYARFTPALARIFPKVLKPSYTPFLGGYKPKSLNNPLIVVKALTNQALLCNAPLCSLSKADSTDAWVGKNTMKHHIPQEHQRLMNALERHGTVSDYSIKALDFQRDTIELGVTGSLTRLNGKLVRVIEITSHAVT